MKACIGYGSALPFRFEFKTQGATVEKSLSSDLFTTNVHWASPVINCCEGCRGKYLEIMTTYAEFSKLQVRLEWKGASETATLRLTSIALHKMQKHCGSPLHVRVTLKNFLVREGPFQIEEHRDETTIHESSEMTIGAIWGILLTAGTCVDNKMKIPEVFKRYANNEELYENDFIVFVKFQADVMVEISDCGFKASGSACHVSTSDNTGSSLKLTLGAAKQDEDFTIVCDGNVEVKCFKAALAERSPVFKAMLEMNCKESLENKVELLDQSEEVVKAFLDYVYTGDFAYALSSSKCASMLLEMADKYHVESLMKAVKYIIITKPVEWFDVGVAFHLYTKFGCLPGFEDTKKKAVQVMKAKYHELKEDENYKSFMGIPTNAIELIGEFAKE